jgi:hypothetical protein
MQHQTFARETPRQIEARLDDDRKALSSALGALGAKLSLDALWSDGLSLIKSNSGPYTHALDRAIRTNPVAIALTSIGLAWLILGRRTQPTTEAPPLPGTHVEAVARWEDEGGPVTGTSVETPGSDDAWIEDADRLRARAKELISHINTAMRKSAAPLAQLAVHRADVLAALTQDVRRVMARGLEHLSDNARDLAVAGRERNYAAHVQGISASAKPLRVTPLTTGVAFAAAGAILATLLPQSAAENDALGTPRDQLVDSLRHALAEERQRFAQSVQRIAQTLLVTNQADRP